MGAITINIGVVFLPYRVLFPWFRKITAPFENVGARRRGVTSDGQEFVLAIAVNIGEDDMVGAATKGGVDNVPFPRLVEILGGFVHCQRPVAGPLGVFLPHHNLFFPVAIFVF
jgi:hypothetical protein